MKVLVTGHNGYIGSVMVPFFELAGHEVVGLDADWFADCVLPGHEVATVSETRCDIREDPQAELNRLAGEGVEAVVHLAALSNDPLGNLDPHLTTVINHDASLRFAVRAKEAGIGRFLFSSSCSTYGAAGDGFLDETAELNPVTAYGIEKVHLEQSLSELADESFSPTYLRNATAYGLSPRLRLDLVLNNLVGWAHTTGKVRLLSDGSAWRPIVHVEDITRAFLSVLEADRDSIHDRAFNVGRTEHNYRIRELAEIVADVVPGTEVEIANDASPDQRTYRVDCDLLPRTLPSFKPQWDARKSAEELYAAYQEIGLTAEQFEGSRYVRLSRLQELRGGGLLDGALRWREVTRGTSN